MKNPEGIVADRDIVLEAAEPAARREPIDPARRFIDAQDGGRVGEPHGSGPGRHVAEGCPDDAMKLPGGVDVQEPPVG